MNNKYFKKLDIQFAVIGYANKNDVGKKFLENKHADSGILSVHESVDKAFLSCYKINRSGGFASVQKMPNGTLTEKSISTLLECI